MTIVNEQKSNYSLPFEDYLQNPSGKFAAVITKSQYAIETGGLTHEGMVADLIKKTRPDLEIDSWGNALKPSEAYDISNVILLGYPYFLLVELPQRDYLSPEQFEQLKNILLMVKKYNDDNHKRGNGRDYELMIYDTDFITLEPGDYQNDIDGLIAQLENYVRTDVIRNKEEIIGIPLKEIQKGIIRA